VDVAEPAAPGPGEVLCRTLELGVCGTDREILHAAAPETPPKGSAREPWLVLGHECLAVVVQTGAGVAELKSGDLVVPTVRRALASATDRRRLDLQDFSQFTERGIYRQHGFSTPFWLDPPQYLLRITPEQRPAAVLAEPVSVAEKGINEALLLQQARLGGQWWTAPPPRVLVTGLGPIGFAALLSCVARGWPTTVYGRDPAESFRAQLVVELGGQYVSAADVDLDPANVEATGFDLLLECTGSDDVLVSVSAVLRSCGVAVWLGSTRRPRPAPLAVAEMMRFGVIRNHLHLGSVNSAPRDFQDALTHLAWHQARRPQALAKLITARVPQKDALAYYVDRSPQGIKTVVEYA
jgi:threonine dehydrogenase-like Zn-dependent dehydrogenase